MNRLSFKNVGRLTGFDLKNNIRLIIGWAVSSFAITFLYMILFSSMQDMALTEWDNMPEELFKFMGINSFTIMYDYNGYFGMMYNLLLIAVSIFTVTFSAGLIYKEEKNKSIEFLYSCKVSRTEIYVSKVLTAVIGVLIVLISLIASAIICGFLNGGETFVINEFFRIALVSGFIAFSYMGVALCLGGATARFPVGMISSMVVVFTYMLGYLGDMLNEKGEFLLYFSPFQIFSPTNALELSDNTVIHLIIYIALMILLISIGGVIYKRRDYKI